MYPVLLVLLSAVTMVSGETIPKIYGSELDAKLNNVGSQLVVVTFYADWCTPCRLFERYLETLAEDFPNVLFLRVNIDESSDVAEQYGVNAMPTTILFINGGNVKQSVVGAAEQKLQNAIEDALK